ncbi:MAG TPA: PqqD family protein [Thermodesulfobacteriota bacterium]|nr:PqqD family protein [Thermodesulfobacteriota bacterium]
MHKFYQKNSSVICTELDDGAVLLNLDTKYYYNLNETGLRIWQIMDEFQSPTEIAKKLVNEYEIDAERAETSVIKLIEEMEKEELILLKKGGD